MQLDLGLLIAGAKERGELESRVTNLLSEIRAAGDVVLMCVPELASQKRLPPACVRSAMPAIEAPDPTCACCVLYGLYWF